MTVTYSETSLRYLQKLDQKTKKRIFEAIQRLPGQGDIIKMKGQKIRNIFRLRVGSYRILFVMEEETIKVLDIAPRGNAYK
jgi:mRNA-degrading endonuclease RelE of RelBE toxin-antitoxin system